MKKQVGTMLGTFQKIFNLLDMKRINIMDGIQIVGKNPTKTIILELMEKLENSLLHVICLAMMITLVDS